MGEDSITVIQLKTSTRERLKAEGKKGETYDEILVRLLEPGAKK
jgi:hypothetical protein